MSEIKDILKKNDLAGVVVLHTEGGFSEFLAEVQPSYSVATILPNNRLHFKAKLEDFDGNERFMHHKLRETSGMLKHLSDVSHHLASQLTNASDVFDSLVDAEHSKGTIISQQDLDN